MRQTFLLSSGLCVAALAVYAQPGSSRQATIRGGGSPDSGKCTIEVVVDGAAEVEIRGNTATLRNVSGQNPQWRRFECTSMIPSNPVNFQFAGVDGRGRQSLVNDPRNGGPAVVRIEDTQGGPEAYTFDITWGGSGRDTYSRRGEAQAPPARSYEYPEDRYRPGYRDSEYYRRYGHGFATDEAVRVCQNAIADQASRRFGRGDFHFRGVRLDDGPGRRDWVIGSLDVHGNGRIERFDFSCSVDFNTGQVRTAELEREPARYRR